MGEGALRTGESVLDTLNDISDAINNPLTYAGNKALYGENTAKKALKESKQKQEEFIKRDLVNEMNEATGWNAMKDKWEQDSLVKSGNIAGQVAQGIGGMVPSLVAGNYLGFNPGNVSAEGLTGLAKAGKMASNVGRTYLSQLPANALLTASSYGSGLQEALNEGATRNQARLYGLSDAAIEQLTEMMTGGVPGLEGRGGIDQLVEPLIDKTGKGYANALLKAGYGALGEGLEEYTSEMLNPLAKKIYSDEPINWDETREKARQAGLVGGITGAFLNTPSNIQNFNEARAEQQNKQALKPTQNTISEPTQMTQETQNIEDRPINQEVRKTSEEEVLKPISQREENIDNTQEKVYNEGINEKESVQNDFRRVQEESRAMSTRDTEMFHSGERQVDEGIRNRLSNVLGGELRTKSSSSGYGNTSLVNPKTNKNVNYYTGVDADTFHDNMEIVQKYLRNGDAVDVHDAADYKDTKNYLSEDGLSGFAITKDGDLISVFNLGEKGYLDTIAPEVQKNAKTLDCFQSDVQPLADMYEKKLGFKKAAEMDFNYDFLAEEKGKEYADYFVKTYGEAPVVFMVKTDQDVPLKHFNKDQYDEAMNYRNSFVAGEGSTEGETNKASNEPSTKTEEFKNSMKKVQDGTATEKERKFVRTAVEAQNTQDLIKEMTDVQKNYKVITNEESMNKAQAQLSSFKNIEQKTAYIKGLLTSGKRITSSDITAAELVLKDVAATKNAKLYTDSLADFAALSTEYGQVIQAMSQIKKLSPTYQLDVLEKLINREVVKGNKKYSNVKVTDDMRNKVLQCYDENGNLNQEKFDNTMEEIKQELADKIKVGADEKVRAWRYLSMLGNPKTHVRNVVANTAMTIDKYVEDKLSAAAQDVFIKDKTKKTRTLKGSSQEVKNYTNELYNEVSSDTFGNKYNEKSDLEDRAKVFNTRWLEAIRQFNDKALSKEDQAFKEINFKRSFSNYLTAQGIETKTDIENKPQIVERAKLYAIEEANVATFNQQNKLAQFINSGDTKLGPLYKVVRGAIIPFTRTPLNIAKAGLERTPGVGLAKLAMDVKKAPSNMKGTVFIDGLSKQVTGTSLALIGYALAKSGRVTAETDDDKEDKFSKDQGEKMDFSIKFGNKSYDLSWLSPTSMPFFVGARMFEVMEKQDGFNENIVLESLASTLDPLSEMSCVSSFTDVLKSYNKEGAGMIKDMGITTAQNYLSQFIPTISGQFARIFDDTKRSTGADASSTNKISQETYRKLAYKIPGLRNTLPESTDIYGREKKEDDNTIIRAFNALINPSNVTKDTMTKEGKELMRLYDKTGNSDIIPSYLSQSVKYKDKEYKMSRKEYNEYKKDFGDNFEDNLKGLMKTEDYKKATNDEKAEMIEGILKYAKDKTKDIFLTNQGEEYSSTSDKVDLLTDRNFTISDYYVYKTYTPNIVNGKYEAVKNRLSLINTFGIDPKIYSNYMPAISEITGENRKQKVFNYINGLNISKKQKQLLMKKEYPTYREADQELFNTINNSNLTKEEKESLRDFLKIGR